MGYFEESIVQSLPYDRLDKRGKNLENLCGEILRIDQAHELARCE